MKESRFSVKSIVPENAEVDIQMSLWGHPDCCYFPTARWYCNHLCLVLCLLPAKLSQWPLCSWFNSASFIWTCPVVVFLMQCLRGLLSESHVNLPTPYKRCTMISEGFVGINSLVVTPLLHQEVTWRNFIQNTNNVFNPFWKFSNKVLLYCLVVNRTYCIWNKLYPFTPWMWVVREHKPTHLGNLRTFLYKDVKLYFCYVAIFFFPFFAYRF